MPEKIIFAIEQYSFIFLFAGSAYGLGSLLTRRLYANKDIPRLASLSIDVSVGLGIFILFYTLAGAFGQLNASVVIFITFLGLIVCFLSLQRTAKQGLGSPKTSSQAAMNLTSLRPTAKQGLGRAMLNVPAAMSSASKWWLLVVVIASFTLLIRPLQVPEDWDELMYHLPMAKAWAESGSFVVAEWLRYPLFPSNMDLLYAVALLVGDDVLPHMAHALTGALAIALAFSVVRQFLGWKVAALTVVQLALATKWGWDNAYVDLGLMLFIFCSFVALAIRYHLCRREFCYLAAFFLGLALGTKYQAFFYVPAFVATILLIERNFMVIARSAVIVALVGGFWYLRNYLISGDPLHPVGGPLFGFWLWNAEDLQNQLGNLEGNRNLPPFYLLLCLGSAAFWRSAPPLLRGLIIATFISLSIWFLLSGHSRYLTPVYPMMSILSAYFLVRCSGHLGITNKAARLVDRIKPGLRRGLMGALTLLIIGVSMKVVYNKSLLVFPNFPSRDAYLMQKFPGYEIMRSLDAPPEGTVYQYGFENEIYYLGNNVMGDWYGPARYNSIFRLRNNPGGLAGRLNDLGARYFLVNMQRDTHYFSETIKDPGFPDHFSLVKQTSRAALYRLGRP